MSPACQPIKENDIIRQEVVSIRKRKYGLNSVIKIEILITSHLKW